MLSEALCKRGMIVSSSFKSALARDPFRSSAFLRLWLGLNISYLGEQFTFLVGPVLAGILATHVGGAYVLLIDEEGFLLMGLLVFLSLLFRVLNTMQRKLQKRTG